ncbi:MAG: hypothetical protein M3S32_01405 [Acidobacteriota bacterium]|nr:hypothetical protein [Acidobacteriota bacterium]
MRSAAVVLLLLVSCGPLANWVECVPDCCAASEDGSMPSCAAAQGSSAGECQLRGCMPDSRVMTLGAALPAILAPVSPSLTLERSAGISLPISRAPRLFELAPATPPPRA